MKRDQAVAERVDITTDRMKNNYRKGKKNTGKGKIAVKNVAAATGVYLPYYSEDISQEVYPGAELIYTFYPSLSGQKLKGLSDERKQALADWRDVPEEDMKAVSSLCQAAGLSGSLSVRENVQRLAQYYQENIPYSYRPGNAVSGGFCELFPYEKQAWLLCTLCKCGNTGISLYRNSGALCGGLRGGSAGCIGGRYDRVR